MVVSILEANSAQTAGLYMPVSRLHPRRELIDRVGADFCREHSVLPLWEQSGSVLVVTTHTRDQDMLRELRQRLGQPVTLRISGRGEIGLALDNATGQPTHAGWRRALADVLQSLRVMHPEQVATYAFGAEDEPYLGANLVDVHMISEDERLEAVGLAFHLPSINLDEHRPITGLDALLPADMLTSLRVLPLWSIRDEVFIAFDQPPTVELLERLDQALGVAIRPVLVQPAQLTSRIQSLPVDGPLSAGDIGEALTHAGVASRTQIEAASRIAMQTGEPLERAIARVAGLSEEAIRTAMVADTLRDAFIRYDAELESRQKIIEEVESVDTATGATKRQHADRLLNIEVERARRYSRQFTMVIIGPDKWAEFVTVNGPGQADRTVTALSHEYLTRLRNVDTLIHMEGATFAVLLPETPVTGAQVVAEKLVDVGEVILGGGGELRAGIAGFPDDEVTGGGLIREATEALHFAEAASIRVASRSLLS